MARDILRHKYFTWFRNYVYRYFQWYILHQGTKQFNIGMVNRLWFKNGDRYFYTLSYCQF